MSSSAWTRSRRSALAAVAGAGMVAATLSTTGAATAAPPADVTAASNVQQAFEDGRYVVVMRDEPVASYDGGVAGYESTKPARGKQYAPRSERSQAYRAYLTKRQDAALADVGNPGTVYRYTESLSGFTANLSGRQAARLAKHPAVLAVTEDELRQVDTVASPDFLGLTGPKGVWSQLGGLAQPAGAGAGVVVGVIDTGIWPENPSFSGAGFTVPTDWNGTCQAGVEFPKTSCNGKLIGARYFVDGFGKANLASHEYLSPRDTDGHGTHTASTAAGNDGVETTIDGRTFGAISGMAPEAHIAAYKVCWDGKTGGGCFNSDSAAAIDQAVADGVDVLNFSISGTSTNFLDPVEFAFMNAADAGVFVAASSGNDGPTASTTNHPSPWLTTVAASTHRILEKSLLTGNGARYIGSSITEPLPAQTPMVLSDTIPASGVAAKDAALCLPGSLDATKAAGKLVVCDRGVNARVEKSQTVAAAGGAGMVLVNVTPGSLDTDLHAVPTVHLPDTVRDEVRAYVGTAGATGAIEDSNEGSTTQVPEVAGFSSRGPTLAAGGDLLKPDISAPGVGVLAAYSPRPAGRSFDFLSGTSMSSPHIAGLGALMKDAHPTWTPMAIKSAMMTTARDHASAASNNLFAGGAGFVEPRRFLNPGLVYDSTLGSSKNEIGWWDFLAGQGVRYSDGTPISETPIDASDLNQASIAIGALAGQQSVTRTVTNVSGSKATWTASVTGVPGVDVEVTPSRITLAPGAKATFTATFTSTRKATFGSYAQGHLTWKTGKGSTASSVRSPIAVKPVAVAAPAEVHAAAGAESVSIGVTAGFSGTLSTQVKGLAAGDVTAGTAANTGGADFDAADSRNYKQELQVGESTSLLRVELAPANPADDLDLFITDSEGEVVAFSASGTAAERITRSLPAGTYTVHVQAWAVDGGGSSTSFDVREFQVGDTSAGNLVMSPASTSVSIAEKVTFTGAFTGLDASVPYLGWVGFYNGGTLAGRTLVSVG